MLHQGADHASYSLCRLKAIYYWGTVFIN